MTVHSVHLESDVELPASVTLASVQSLVTYVLNTESIDEPWQLGIRFVDDSTMQTAHAEFMGIDEPTDIMTFPYADEDDLWGESEAGGDLIISVDCARENADMAGWTLTDELFFLVVHGALHLLGWDDHASADRAAMLQRQLHLFEGWKARP